MNVKEFYTAKELAEMKLHSLPSFHVNVRRMAEKKNWQSRPRSGRGGGLEYAFDGLPIDVQNEIKTREVKALMAIDTPKSVATYDGRYRDINTLTHKDRRVADNRLLITLLVERYAHTLGTQDKAIKQVSRLSRMGALPIEGSVDYNLVCQHAKARTEKTGVGTRTLHKWIIEAQQCNNPTDRLAVMSPSKQGRPKIDVLSVAWLPRFLQIYRNPNGLSVSRCYELWRYEHIKQYGTNLGLPSLAQVRSILKKIPPLERERGRITGSKLKEIDSYIKRDWNHEGYANNHIWVGDGHSLKCSVKHHKSGQAVIPEITLIIDAPSRYIVGYSLSYSESGMAVLSALRNAWAKHGLNAIYYSDNGKGQKNAMLSDEDIGIFARLGITHMTGIPGNPQGRGIIERLMKEVPKRVAQSFASYHGSDADPDTVRGRMGAKLAYNKATMDGKVTGQMTTRQRKGDIITPTMGELREVVEALIDEYNTIRKHRSIGMTPAQKRAELDKVHGANRVWLSDLDLRELAVSVVERKTSRGWLRHNNNFYFSQSLIEWHGKNVYLYANDDNVADVMVRDKQGVYICTAVINGNSTPAIPLDLLEQAEQKRVNQAIKRKENAALQLKQQTQGRAIIEAKQMLYELGECTEWGQVSDGTDDDGFEFYAELDWDRHKKAI